MFPSCRLAADLVDDVFLTCECFHTFKCTRRITFFESPPHTQLRHSCLLALMHVASVPLSNLCFVLCTGLSPFPPTAEISPGPAFSPSPLETRFSLKVTLGNPQAVFCNTLCKSVCLALLAWDSWLTGSSYLWCPARAGSWSPAVLLGLGRVLPCLPPCSWVRGILPREFCRVWPASSYLVSRSQLVCPCQEAES